MRPIYCVQTVPIDVLRCLAIAKPEEWADAYDAEITRRHPAYRVWLSASQREDTPANLDHFMRGFR